MKKKEYALNVNSLTLLNGNGMPFYKWKWTVYIGVESWTKMYVCRVATNLSLIIGITKESTLNTQGNMMNIKAVLCE